MKQWATKQKGFTIVELLIVVVVIAILAAITIVSYNGIQARSTDTAVRSDVANLAKRFGAFHADNGFYPNTSAHMQTAGFTISNKNAYLTDTTRITYNVYACVSSDNQAFALAAITKNGTRIFAKNGTGVEEYTGSVNWIATGSVYNSVCSDLLPGSAIISSGSGWGNGSWRAWAA